MLRTLFAISTCLSVALGWASAPDPTALLKSTWTGALPQDPAPSIWECKNAFSCDDCKIVIWVDDSERGQAAYRKCDDTTMIMTCQGGTVTDCNPTNPPIEYDCGASNWFADAMCSVPIAPPAGAPPCRYPGC